MPKSIQQIIDHADELARMIEDDELTFTRQPDSVAALHRAVLARTHVEAEIIEAVKSARADNVTWTTIAQHLGVSPQGAANRYGKLVEA